jgi:Bax protein
MKKLFFLFTLLSSFLSIAQDSLKVPMALESLPEQVRNRPDTFQICYITEMLQLYKEKSFILDSIRKHKFVPPIYAVNFPPELKTAPFPSKKSIFIGSVLAAILKANDKVLKERAEIQTLSLTDSITSADSIVLAEYKRKYYASSFEELLHKVDILPPSLVIAQGINESGWGTSFFARQANSIFGLKAPAKSSIPTIKHPKTSFKTYKFRTLEEGIEEYLLNMNRHKLYKPLHDIRAQKRIKGLTITGKALLPGMKRYSSRGSAYLRTVTQLINMYHLEDFDTCTLSKDEDIFLRFVPN